MRSLTSAFLIAGSALLLAACDSKNDSGDFEGAPTAQFVALFDPSNSVIPFPSNVLFSGTLDGTLNIPVKDATDIADPQVALNALDGFSTIAPMATTFSQAIDPDLSNLAASVRVFTADLAALTDPLPLAVTDITGELMYGVDFFAAVASTDPDGTTLSIVPLRPLQPASGYVVGIAKTLRAADGQAAGTDTIYDATRIRGSLVDGSGESVFVAFTDAQATALEPLRLLTNAQDDALNNFPAANSGLADEFAIAWAFKTQSIGTVLNTVRTVVQGSPAANSALVDSGANSPLGAADLYVGTLEVPYYLTAAANANDPTPLGTWWQAANEVAGETNLTGLNPLPAATGTQTIPLLVSIPMGVAANWPVVIFQHGLTRNRGVALGIVDSLAAAGFAVVSIDLPLHGITGRETDGTAPFRMAGVERTFDLDLVTQVGESITAQVPDGEIDTSGRHSINPASLLTTRDNLRQAVADLFTLARALTTMTTPDGDTFDTTDMHMVGYSTGGFAGAVMLSMEPTVGDAVLAMTGGGLAKSLDASALFGPEFAAGLEAVGGLVKGTADYESFIGAMQTALDAGDPVNYADPAAPFNTIGGRNLMMVEVVGDGADNLPDQVLINNVFPAPIAGTAPNTLPSPTAGTDPQATLMGLTVVNTSPSTEGTPWLRFTAGHHGSLLTPNDAAGNPDMTSAFVTGVMQQAVSTFLATNGMTFTMPAGFESVVAAP